MLISAKQVGSPRILKRFPYLISSVQSYVDRAKLRYGDITKATGNDIQFVTSLLSFVDDAMVKEADMLDVYLDSIIPIIQQVQQKFDVVAAGVKTRDGIFMPKNVKESFIPSTGILGNEVTVLDGWNKWKNIYPIKLMYHDSSELIIPPTGSLVFKKDQPTSAIFNIDIEALLIKYIIYLKKFNKSTTDMDISRFINDYILIGFYDDLVDIWVSKLLLAIGEDDVTPQLVSTVALSKSTFNDGVRELKTMYDGYVQGNFRLGSLLNTKIYPTRSIAEMIHDYDEIYMSPSSHRYIGYYLCKMGDLMIFTINCLGKSNKRGLETAAIRTLIQDSRMLKRLNWQSHVRDKNIISRVNEIFLELETFAAEF